MVQTVCYRRKGDKSLLQRYALEDPTSDEPKTFEALTELAVFLRLLTNETNNPLIPVAPITITDPFEQTTMQNIYELIEEAKIRFYPYSTQGSGDDVLPVLQFHSLLHSQIIPSSFCKEDLFSSRGSSRLVISATTKASCSLPRRGCKWHCRIELMD